MHVGKRLKELRESKGYSLRLVEEKTNLKNIHRYEKGYINSLKCSQLITFSDLYEVSPMYLLGLDERTYSIEPKWVVLIQKLKDKGINPRDVMKCVEREFDLTLRCNRR